MQAQATEDCSAMECLQVEVVVMVVVVVVVMMIVMVVVTRLYNGGCNQQEC